MAAETPSQRLKRYSKMIPDESAMRRIIQSLEKEKTDFADYAIALICATFIEKALEVAIMAHLAPFDETANQRIFDYDNRGPLADFSAKIKMSYAMGIFGKNTKKDLDLIREIRNAFAHSLQSISFKTKEVADMCNFEIKPAVRITIVGIEPDARKKYITATTTLAGHLKIALGRTPAIEATRAIWMFQRQLP